MKKPLKIGDVVRAKPTGESKYRLAKISEVQLNTTKCPQIPLRQPLYWVRFTKSGFLGARWESELEPTL